MEQAVAAQQTTLQVLKLCMQAAVVAARSRLRMLCILGLAALAVEDVAQARILRPAPANPILVAVAVAERWRSQVRLVVAALLSFA